MKLFNYRNNDTLLSNSPMYSILAVYMPFTILTALIIILDAVLTVNLYAILLIICGIISAITASLYHDFMKDVKSEKKFADIRGGIIIMVALYFLTSPFFLQSPWAERFIPNYLNISAAVCALYSWVSVISLKQLFNARRRFEIITEMYEGERLKEKLFEDSGLLQYTDESINKAKLNYFIQLCIIGLLVILCAILEINLPVILYILLIIILIGGVCIHGLFAIIKWEQYYAGEGINLSGHDRIKRIISLIILSLICLIFALLLSSEKNLIPFSIITGFFTWLFSLFRRFPVQLSYTENSDILMQGDIVPDFSQFAENTSSPFWELFIKYASIILKYGLIILAIALFIRFMISPLLNRGDETKKLTFFQKLKLIVREWYNGILNIIKTFIASFKKDKTMKLNSNNNDDISRTAKNIFNAYSSGNKRNLQGSVTLFAQLIIWGEETRKVIWKPSLAPLEYCRILASALPADIISGSTDDETGNKIFLEQQNNRIIRCGMLFEQALYSSDDLSDEEQNEFKNAIEEIISVTGIL